VRFDLEVHIRERPTGLTGSFLYSRDLFEAETIERMVSHYVQLLKAIASKPDEGIKSLQFLTDEERRKLIVDWNSVPGDYQADKCMHELVEEQVARTPDAIAVEFGDQRLTYRELNGRANQLAHYLRASGIGPDSRVGLCVERSLEMAIGVLGILKAGAAYVPLDPTYPPERLAFLLRDSRAQVLLTQRALMERLTAATARTVQLDLDWPDIARQSPENPAVTNSPENLAYMIYTSGSTGQPKGVAMPHRPLVNLIAWQMRESSVRGPDATLQFASISFDVSFQETFSTYCSGGKLIIAPDDIRHDPAQLAKFIARHGIRRLFLPPVVLQYLAEAVAAQPDTLATLREIIVAGEQLQVTQPVAALLDRLTNCALHNHYGPTEAHVVTAFPVTRVDGTWPALPPIGRPISNARIYLLDSAGQPVPVGVPGELHIGGACLARGYHERPELTAEKFVPDPFSGVPGARLYKTGDLARYRSDGAIECLGRRDDQVKIRGFRIELGEIESALGQHPAVREAVVVTREDEPGNKRLVAYVVRSAADAVSRNDLHDFLVGRLPRYMVPGAFTFLETLPLSPNGKVDRRALPVPDAGSSDGVGRIFAPRDKWEAQLHTIWQNVLGRSAIGVTDDFFAIGGHSLLAVQMIDKVKSIFGIDVPLTSLFEAPTIEKLAHVLRDGIPVRQWPTLVPVRQSGTKPPLFFVARPNVNALGYAILTWHLGADTPVYVLQSQRREQTIKPYSQQEYEEIAAEYISAMRGVRPNGPYYLGGMCEGAHIAFEMIRQLEAQSVDVRLLAILDTWAQENTRRRWVWRFENYRGVAVKILRRGPREWKRALARRFTAVASPIARVVSSRNSSNCEAPSGPASEYWVQRYFPGKDWVPPRIGAKIVVFRIKKQPIWRVSDPSMGWSCRTTGDTDIRVVPGDHFTIIREPYVQQVAAALAECLKPTVDADRAGG
jgi:amino acid adenylation domain-containing protein